MISTEEFVLAVQAGDLEKARAHGLWVENKTTANEEFASSKIKISTDPFTG